MRRMLYPAALALIVLTPDLGCAKGGYVRLPEPKTVAASVLPAPALPRLSPGDMLGGCGKGRFRDAATHRCRGPADTGN
jgi:hypothetical protein